MTKRFLTTATLAAALSCLAGQADAAPMATIALGPAGGVITGGAGDLRTITYLLTNTSDAGEWLDAVNIDVNEVLPLPGTADPSVFGFPGLGPGAAVAGNLLEFEFDAVSPVGTIGSGEVDIRFDVYSSHPQRGGQLIGSYTLSTGFRAVKVAEPFTLAMLLVGGGVTALRRRRS